MDFRGSGKNDRGAIQSYITANPWKLRNVSFAALEISLLGKDLMAVKVEGKQVCCNQNSYKHSFMSDHAGDVEYRLMILHGDCPGTTN